MSSRAASPWALLLLDLGFNELRQKDQRFLPAHVTGFDRDDARHSFLCDVHLRTTEDLFEKDSHRHHAREVRVIKDISVAQLFVRDEFEILAAEGHAALGGEIGEGHPEAASNFGIHVVDGGGEAVRRQPLAHGSGVDEGAIDALRRRAQDAMELNAVRGHEVKFLTRAARRLF